MYAINLGIKVLLFGFFTALIFYVINYIISLAPTYLPVGNAYYLLNSFGVLQALSLYLSIVSTGFGIRQVLNFIKT